MYIAQEGARCRSVQDAEGYMVHGGGCEVQESVGCGRVRGAGWIEEDAGCMCAGVYRCRRVQDRVLRGGYGVQESVGGAGG